MVGPIGRTLWPLSSHKQTNKSLSPEQLGGNVTNLVDLRVRSLPDLQTFVCGTQRKYNKNRFLLRDTTRLRERGDDVQHFFVAVCVEQTSHAQDVLG